MLDPQKKLDAPTLLLIGGIIFWIALYAIIGPQAPGCDVSYFKDSGINLAIGKGLREVCTYGNPSLEYKYYANYPPVYPFLYGLYVSVVGIGDYQNTYFNLLLQIAKAILIFMIVVRYGTDWTPNQKLIITGILVLFLPSAISYDRPEDLVIVLFLVSLLFYLQRQPEAVFLVAGLNLMTSPVCGLISAVILLGIYFHDVFKEKVDWKIFSEKSYPVLYMLVFPVIIIAILAFLDTSIFERFYDYVKYILTNAKGEIRPKGVVEYVKRALSAGLFFGKVTLLSFVLIVLLGLVASFSAYRALEKRLALFMIAVIGMVIFLNWQGRAHYYQFLTVLGLTVGMYVMMKDVEKVREMRRKVFWVCLGIILLMTLPRTARDIYVRLVPMSSERYKDAKEQVKNFFKDKPDEFILSSSEHFFIVKSVKQKVVADTLFSADEPNIPRYIVAIPTKKDSIITLTPDPKIFTPKVEKAFFYRKVFETEKSVPNPQNTFWERLLMRPQETWYPVIYERIDEQ
jgi:hypothetical protein